MAKSTITVTNTWTLISAVKCVITVNASGTKPLFINEVGSDTNATQFNPNVNDQFRQNEVKDTYVRSEDSWILSVDEEG
jgi:hypothetical protein